MIHEENDNGWNCKHYADIQELVSEPDPSEFNSAWQACKNQLRSSGSIDWYGIPGGMHAMHNAVSKGWPEGRERMERLLDEVQLDVPKLRTTRRRKARRRQGDEVDMQAVYRGDLDRAWRTVEKQYVIPPKGGGRRVVVAVATNAPSQTSPNALFWRGAATILLSRMLVTAGYAVELTAIKHNANLFLHHEDPTVVSVRLKQFDQPLDLDALTVSTALAGFCRLYLFRAACTFPNRTTANGLGRSPPCGRHRAPDIHYFKDRAKHTIFVPGPYITDKTLCIEWLNKQAETVKSSWT